MDQKTEIKKLEFLIGEWNTQGIIMATDTSPEIKIHGTDKYEWVADGFFILHTVDVIMGNDAVKAVEIIGFDKELKRYTMQSFESGGAISFMNGNCDLQNAFVITGEEIRATLTTNASLTEMNANWEKSDDGITWTPWMNVTLSK